MWIIMANNSQTSEVTWYCKSFSSLNTTELYDFLKLRIDVFVVEQTCYYPDLDDHDRHADTLHLFCYQNEVMTAYLRILPTGLTYQEHISIGRVVIAPEARGTGLGHELMTVALAECKKAFPTNSLKISAQEHLEKYYNKHGFERVSNMYLEDNIPHIAMIKVR